MGLYVDIRKRFPDFFLDVRFNADSGTLGLLGASGAGKSMTLRCIAGLEKPDEGRIVLNDRVLFDSGKGINIPSRKRKTGLLFQNYALFPNMTVEENIGFALNGIGKSEKIYKVQQKIKMVRLQGMEKRYPHQLSGGQQQRVALARALATDPEALLLDEPFSALDNHLRNLLIKQLMDALFHYRGITMLVTHNIEEAYMICDRMIVLLAGKVEAYEKREKLYAMPPTLATAQLTGCKNFSIANYLSQDELEAVDWGIKLKSKNTIAKDMKYVSFRSHCLRPASEKDRYNLFKCRPSSVSETLSGKTIYLSIESAPPGLDNYQLQWEVSKEKWQEIQQYPLPWTLCLDPEKLIILNR